MGKNVILTHVLPATESSCYSSERPAGTTVLMNKSPPCDLGGKVRLVNVLSKEREPCWPPGDQISRNILFYFFLFQSLYVQWLLEATPQLGLGNGPVQHMQAPSWAWAMGPFSTCKGLAQSPGLRKKIAQPDSVRLESFLHGYSSLKFQGGSPVSLHTCVCVCSQGCGA